MLRLEFSAGRQELLLLGGLALLFLVLRKGQSLGAAALILAFQLFATRCFANSLSQQVQAVIFSTAALIAAAASTRPSGHGSGILPVYHR